MDKSKLEDDLMHFKEWLYDFLVNQTKNNPIHEGDVEWFIDDVYHAIDHIIVDHCVDNVE